VGGVNPSAVEAVIKYGARQIWLPTIDSTNHAVVTGSLGQHGRGLTIAGGLSDFARTKQRLFLLTGDGALVPALHEVLRMVADADVILNLGHISFKEMTAIVPAAKKQGVKRIVCDHPFFSRLSVAQQVELADQGVWINFTAGELLPRWWRVSIADFAAAIRTVGIKRAVVSSDCGQLHNPPMVEALRITCQLLLEEDFTPDDIKVLLHHNPAALIYP
jgi:Family of unknown function (DUF6282)